MRVVIVEDDALLREGLVLLLRTEGFDVVAAAECPDEFLAALDEEQPDAAIVDIRLPPTYHDEGLRAAVEARRRRPGLPVLILSAHVEHSYAAELLSHGGGIGYLLKERVGKVARFLDAFRRVVEGGTAIDPDVVAQLLTRQRKRETLGTLSKRELEVLGLMAEGYDNRTMSDMLSVTETSVSKHIRSIFAKLDLRQSGSGHRRVLAVLAYLRDETLT